MELTRVRAADIIYTGEAICGLILYDLVSLVGFSRAHRLVKRCPTIRRRANGDVTARICWAVAEASVWYVKRVRCLQRSAVTTWLLRLHGVPGELVIGSRTVPFSSHAWVEVGGEIVNDRPQYQKFFRVMDRL